MKSISQATLQSIHSLLLSGSSTRQIASELGLHQSTVSRLRSEHFPDLQKPALGRPAKLSSTTMRHAHYLIASGKSQTAVDMAKFLQETLAQLISSETIRRGLKNIGLKAVVKAERPYLSKRHRKERLQFAQAHQHWTIED